MSHDSQLAVVLLLAVIALRLRKETARVCIIGLFCSVVGERELGSSLLGVVLGSVATILGLLIHYKIQDWKTK